MKLMGIREYIETRYTEQSRPSDRYVIKLIREGVIPGIKQGKFYYVDLNEEKKSTGNELVDSVL